MHGSAIIQNQKVSLSICILCFLLVLISSGAVAGNNNSILVQEDHKIKVTLQLTDFIVRDSDGKFVSGLTADDFRITVDGQQREISFVDESAGSLSVVFFFDRFNLGPKALEDAKNLAKEIVTSVLSEDDRVAVVHYDGVLQTELGWSSDHSAIRRAIDDIKASDDNRYYYPPILEVSSPMAGEEESIMDNEYSMADEDKLKEIFINKSKDLTNYVYALNALADALRNIRGRKTCLVFSEGPNTYETSFRLNTAERSSNYRGEWAQRKLVSMTVRNRQATYLHKKIGLISIKDAEVKQELAAMGKVFDGSNTTLTVIRPGEVDPEWKTVSDTKIKSMISPHVYRFAKVPIKLKRMQEDRVEFLETMSRLSNGSYFDAATDNAVLISRLRDEMRNYYVVGFEPPGDTEISYHSVQVDSIKPDLKLIHRKGYFSKLLFKNMTAEQKQVHLEEDLNAPGINNDLDLKVGTCPWLPSGNPSILLCAELKHEILGISPDGNHELEMVINLIDSGNRLRFREHHTYSATSGTLAGESIWFKQAIPRSEDKCIAYISIRDNVTGKKSTWNKVLEPVIDAGTSPKFHGTMMLKTKAPGNLQLWHGREITNTEGVEEALSVPSLRISGKPVLDYKIEQGDEVVFFSTIGNLPDSFDATQAQIGAFFILDPESDTRYQLSCSDLRVSYLAERKEIMISAGVPLGLAQRKDGQLAVVVTGVSESTPYIVFMPYHLIDFSSEKARDFLKDPRIKLY